VDLDGRHFLAVGEGGRIEELRSTNIDMSLLLLGFTPTDFYGGTFYSCPTMPPTLDSGLRHLLQQQYDL